MATNLISDVMRMATPALMDRIASSLGVNASIVNSVLGAAVPAIFSGVADKASTQTGLNGVMAALNHAKPDFADSLGTALTSGNSGSLISAGTKMLSSVLSGGELGNLTNAITKSTGASAAATGSLVAIAGQLAMSAFAKQAMGLDGAGVTDLLNSQRGQFQDALPSSLTNILSGAGTMASSTTTRATTAATSTATQAAATTSQGGTNWLMWLVPLVLIAAALWYFLGMRKNVDEAAAPAASTTTQQPAATPAAGNIMVDNVDVTQTLGTSLTGLTGALGGITDAASAQTAVAKIQDAAKGIDTVSGLAAKFTPEQKTAVAGLVNAALPAIKDSATKVEAMAGVGDLVKPVLDGLLGKLDALTK
jgi:Bacterial protein of unknown function (DUF937)